MKQITINHHNYYVPSSWDAMTQKELLALAKICRTAKTTMEIQLKFFLACVRGRVMSQVSGGVYILKIQRQRHVLFSDELTAITSVFNFLFEPDDNGAPQLMPKLTTNHFKEIEVGLRKLTGPGDALDNITYNQFIWLQTYHSVLTDDKPETLDELISVIYNTNNQKSTLKYVARIDRDIKTVILWYYLGTLSFLAQQFPHALSGGGGSSVTNVFDHQQRILDSLAEGDVTKKDKVRQSLLYDALYTMDEAAKRMKEMEKQHKK